VPHSDETLVRVDAAGICGSDLHAWQGHDARRVPPLILGHEPAGTIVEGPEAGKRVAINPLIGCGLAAIAWKANPISAQEEICWVSDGPTRPPKATALILLWTLSAAGQHAPIPAVAAALVASSLTSGCRTVLMVLIPDV